LNEFSSAPSWKQFPYAGWVPTANGRLSFRHIGEASHPTKSIYANVDATTVRLILAYQARPFSDVLFTPVQELFGITGKFWFAVLAESNSVPNGSDTLRGRVFIFKSKQDWREKGEKIAREPIRAINQRIRFFEPQQKEAELKRQYNDAFQGLAKACDIFVDFELSRTGEIFFATPSFQDIDLRDGSSALATAIGHSFEKSVSDQAYFFLRDLCHKHQHHDENEDTILILQTRTVNETEWRKYVLYSLQYQIIKAKRSSYAFAAIQALGILAYCTSFRLICEMRKGWGEIGDLPTFNDTSSHDSLRAQIDYITATQNAADATQASRLSRSANVRTYALALLAIGLTAFGVLIQPKIDRGNFPRINEDSAYAAEHPIVLLISMLVPFLIIWFGVSDLFAWHIFRWEVGKDILEAANVRRRSGKYLLYAIGLVSVWAAVYFGHPALEDMLLPLLKLWNALG
jgi:hypothetical protein